jgi:pullulanase/glycogen debranching enzyme
MSPGLVAVAMLLRGDRIGEQRAGEPAPFGDSLLLLFNRHHEAVWFTLPEAAGGDWLPVLDTATAQGTPPGGADERCAERCYPVGGRGLAVLRQPLPQE